MLGLHPQKLTLNLPIENALE
ncbi:hypothetical protein DSM3645_00835 [Blastopirellula marina DSM 3645]|uniref:Uncharacterized protein n=1 Tax=Blastopirellula marina DSM 3645 TaxID=314230 RepID=A3ZMP2_9BACT|nr:hypothetical protein DSM3645_00835 [Blastopirellula marina DSM 3645]